MLEYLEKLESICSRTA